MIDMTCSFRVREFSDTTIHTSLISWQAHFLRQMDLALIWTVLTKLLSPSSSIPLHDRPTTDTTILNYITNITGTVIRQRRDLVATTIPHLVVILRLLLDVLRRPRTQLGPRQLQMVADSLPWWINPTKPCGTEEARAVARILTALDAKTIPKVFSNKSKDGNPPSSVTPNAAISTQSNESLARPFSKHAPYVVKAYLAAETDVLCTYPLSLRRELEPGLLALCGMMNEHGRDALMAQSLNAGEMAAMKILWGAYEKQKYVGKG